MERIDFFIMTAHNQNDLIRVVEKTENIKLFFQMVV